MQFAVKYLTQATFDCIQKLSAEIELSCFCRSDESAEFLGREVYAGRAWFGGAPHHNHLVLDCYLNAFAVLAKARSMPIYR